MKVRIDRELNIARILFANTPIADSIETDDGIVIDYDANRRVVGFEFLNASEQLANIHSLRSRQSSLGKHRCRVKQHRPTNELVAA